MDPDAVFVGLVVAAVVIWLALVIGILRGGKTRE
jgi:hypothetical protein